MMWAYEYIERLRCRVISILSSSARVGFVTGGVAAEKGVGKDAQTAANALGEDFYKVILEEEPFKSITV